MIIRKVILTTAKYNIKHLNNKNNNSTNFAGTKHPICAIITIRAICLIKTVFPEELGPVTIRKLDR
jgi:hypothetical protein